MCQEQIQAAELFRKYQRMMIERQFEVEKMMAETELAVSFAAAVLDER
jgi:hypothetical protein